MRPSLLSFNDSSPKTSFSKTSLASARRYRLLPQLVCLLLSFVSFLLSFLFLLVVDFSFQLRFHHVNVLSFFGWRITDSNR